MAVSSADEGRADHLCAHKERGVAFIKCISEMCYSKLRKHIGLGICRRICRSRLAFRVNDLSSKSVQTQFHTTIVDFAMPSFRDRREIKMSQNVLLYVRWLVKRCAWFLS